MKEVGEKTGGVVLLGGRLLEPQEAVVSVFDRGFLYGDSVYETLRTYARKPFLWDRHLRRLRTSAGGIHLDLKRSDSQLAEDVEKVIAASPPGERYLRVMVTRGTGEMGLDLGLSNEPLHLILSLPHRPLPEGAYREGVKGVVAQRRRTPTEALQPQWKTGNYLNNMLALQEAREKGAFDALMLNAAGELAEGTTSNVFLVKNGHLLTPDLASGILPGVTREVVLQVAREEGIPLAENRVTLADLEAADELFLTSTLKEIVPMTWMDGRRVGEGVPGPLTLLLMNRFRQWVDQWTEHHVSFPLS